MLLKLPRLVSLHIDENMVPKALSSRRFEVAFQEKVKCEQGKLDQTRHD